MNDTGISKNESNVLAYHRSNLKPGRYLVNPDGSVTTFRGALFDVPGGVQLVPTYWNGKVLEDPQEIYRNVSKSRLQFPVYKTMKEASAAEKRLHSVMEDDIKQLTNTTLGSWK
jgi:hypothetical protein